MDSATYDSTLTLDLGRVRENLLVIKNHLDIKDGGKGVIAIIKAHGYGTDPIAMADLLKDKVEILAVSNLEEALELRNAGINSRILVLKPRIENLSQLFENSLEPTFKSLYDLKAYSRGFREVEHLGVPVHLKINSGMNRLGLNVDEVDEAAKILLSVEGLKLGTVYTHLAATDSSDEDANTEMQLATYIEVCSVLKRAFHNTPSLLGFKMHALNSGGVSKFPDYKFDYVRLGISLLGVDPAMSLSGLMPAVNFKTRVIQIRKVPKGEGLSYGFSDKSGEERTIAWLPVGYADGYSRSLGCGNGQVFLKDQTAPVVGTVCMGLTAIDVTGINVEVGDEVELFGDNVSIQEVAEKSGTIAYDVFAGINRRVRRAISE